MSPAERPAPTNAQHEPPYPDAETVLFSLRAPDLIAHAPTPRCTEQTPHAIRGCGEFAIVPRREVWGPLETTSGWVPYDATLLERIRRINIYGPPGSPPIDIYIDRDQMFVDYAPNENDSARETPKMRTAGGGGLAPSILDPRD